MGTLEAMTPFATALGLATTRIGALMMASPIFQSASIPSRLKGALTMVLAILVVRVVWGMCPHLWKRQFQLSWLTSQPQLQQHFQFLCF